MSLASTAAVAAPLTARCPEVAERAVALFYERYPEIAARYVAGGRARCVEDTVHHLSYLGEAIAAGSPRLFEDYAAWAAVMLSARGIPTAELAGNLECVRDALAELLPIDPGAVAREFVDGALAALPAAPPAPESFIKSGEPLGGLADRYLRALLAGARNDAAQLVLRAFADGTPLEDLYVRVFVPVQHEVGRLWQLNRLSIAQEHYCTAATQLVMAQFYRELFRTPRNGRTLVAAAAPGELHELGIRMIADIFELNGWNTLYLGANTPTGAIVDFCRAERAEVLALSATITPHVSAVREIIRAARKTVGERLRHIIVGGHPFNVDPDLWQRIGADGWAREPGAVVELCK